MLSSQTDAELTTTGVSASERRASTPSGSRCGSTHFQNEFNICKPLEVSIHAEEPSLMLPRSRQDDAGVEHHGYRLDVPLLSAWTKPIDGAIQSEMTKARQEIDA